ncbi:MAG: hypothetical protein Q9170_000459 [Blastenia crenularia]
MPATDSPALLCARFLKASNYHDTLQAFLAEAGLPLDAASINPGDLTIEQILEEKKVFDLSLAFERTSASAGGREWSINGSLPSPANLLHVSIGEIKEDSDGQPHQVLLASTADRQIYLLDPRRGFGLFRSLYGIHDSPVLSCIVLRPHNMLTVTTSMSGQVILYDHQANRILDERRDHKKYVTKAAQIWHRETLWVATAGWDAMIFLYRFESDVANGTRCLGNPVDSLSLATNPETITFIVHPESEQPLLLVTRRDSTSLHYYCWEEMGTSTSPAVKLRMLGSQNLAPHSNAWISFSPSSISTCPTDPQLLAVATSAVPHMKLIIVRPLIPPLSLPHPEAAANGEPITQASQARRKLAMEDEEDMAMRIHVNTFAPQTPYSTPQVCWRPDGSGVWVNGDDGVLRGFDANSGKLRSTLTGGHELGSKVRTVWAGMVDVDGKEEEWVVSGGFDKRLVVWKPRDKRVT